MERNSLSLEETIRCLHWVSPPLEHKDHKEGMQVYHCSYLTYSFLFSSVTGILRPLGLSSCCKNFPKALCSTQNVWSRTEVMSFSLHKEHESAEMENLSKAEKRGGRPQVAKSLTVSRRGSCATLGLWSPSHWAVLVFLAAVCKRAAWSSR